MTPEENAKELIEQFRSEILAQHSAWNVITGSSFPLPLLFVQKAAIQCAVKYVEKIINATPYYFYPGRKVTRIEDHSTKDYWESVLQQIKNYK